MILRTHVLSALLITLFAVPALADDGFMAIHKANQASDSPVAQFWNGLGTTPALPPPDGFMAVYMANQKVGSAVANFWQLESQSNCPTIDTPQIDSQM